jgi:ABC-type transporter Mla subunit MlaD
VIRSALATGLVACALVLTGCAAASDPAATASASPYSSTVASELQSGVLSVTSSAAGGDPTAALARLDELAATLADARARGAVTIARFDSITASMALVRADLEAAIAAQGDQKPGNSDKPGKGKDGGGD